MPGQTQGSDTGDGAQRGRDSFLPRERLLGAPEESRVAAQSYGAIVWRQFRKRPGAMIGLAIVWLLLTAAVFAPFIASEVPYYWSRNGQITFPVLRYLSNLEIVAIAAYLGTALFIVINWALRRPPGPRRGLPSTPNEVSGREPRRGGANTPEGRGAGVSSARVAGIVLAAWLVVSASTLGFRRAETRYGFYLERRDEASAYLFPPVAYARNPGYAELAWREQPPSRAHPLGTGRLGDDILMGIVYGARTAMTIGFVAVGMSVIIGVCLGAISGYLLGAVDVVLMRLVEIIMCLPRFILIIMLVTVAPANISPIWTVVVVLGLTGWTGVFRLMRAEMLRIRSEDYITAGRALGLPGWRLLLRHAIPNGLAPILVSATFGIASAVFLEASLSFLGLVQTPSWGEILNDGRQHLEQWWMWASSGGAIFLAVFAYNLVGEGLRDAIDPRLKISGA